MSGEGGIVAAEQPSQIELAPCPIGLGAPDQPISIYAVHLPSWMRVPEQANRPLTSFEIAPKLAEYVNFVGFTHVQVSLSDNDQPPDLALVIEELHKRHVGVIFANARSGKSVNRSSIRGDGRILDGKALLSSHEYRLDNAWAEETLAYFGTDPHFRKNRHSQFWHRDNYAFSSNYILPLSETLVMGPRPSLLAGMPGDDWQKFANLRLLFAYMYFLPGKKLLFMGDEFGQPNPWRSETSLDWHVVNRPGFHRQLRDWVSDLNHFYRQTRALHQTDSCSVGFQWVDFSAAELSIVSFLRQDTARQEVLLVVLNFTPATHHNYRVGVPTGGFWTELLNSDAVDFGGSGQGNLGGVEAAPFGWNFQTHSLMLTIPPLAAIVLRAPA